MYLDIHLCQFLDKGVYQWKKAVAVAAVVNVMEVEGRQRLATTMAALRQPIKAKRSITIIMEALIQLRLSKIVYKEIVQVQVCPTGPIGDHFHSWSCTNYRRSNK
jgi:hypothetical protein